MSHVSRNDPDLDWSYDDDGPETWTCTSCGDEIESGEVATWDPIICRLCVEVSEDALDELKRDDGPWDLSDGEAA